MSQTGKKTTPPVPRPVRTLAFILGPLLFVVTGCGDGGRTEGPPNIVLIMADDLGVDVLSSYGATRYATPNIDALAEAGIRFENVYSTPLCTPSRIQLLTGKYPFRTGWVENIMTRFQDGFEGDRFLDPSLPTFASLLRDQGYATAVAGKWQLCRFDERPEHPLECGFERSLCWLWMEGGDDDQGLVHTSRYWFPSVIEDGKVRRKLEGSYGPDLFADFLIQFMEDNRDRPFLAYYPMVLPHAPFQPTANQLDPALVTEDPTPDFVYYRNMVEYMDELVGRVVGAVDRLGLSENTVVLFASDNGTPEEIEVRYLGQVRKGGKGSMSEAGTRVPLIIRWPGIATPGSVNPSLVDLSDLLPTLVEIAGGVVADEEGMDGQSLVPQLRQEEGASAREWVFTQVGDRMSIRKKRYRYYDDGRLFDILKDPLELNNLSDDPARASLVEAMKGELLKISPP